MTKYLTKLRADQLRDGADHAVLSTQAFPAGTQQLVVRDGVVIVHPARAIAVANLLRRQIVQVHSLRLGREGREQKAQALASRDRLQASGELSAPIVTEILPAMPFYPAEAYHQQYVEKGGYASCHVRRKSPPSESLSP